MFDFAIAGAGIAGASIARELSVRGASVLLLEMEGQPGFHTTGRSAAMYAGGYGPKAVRVLTAQSRDFYFGPEPDFANAPMVGPAVGCLFIAWKGEAALLDAKYDELSAELPGLTRLSAADAQARVPVLRTEALEGALFEAGSAAMDVNEIHGSYLRDGKRRGVKLVNRAELVSGVYDGSWRLETKAGSFDARILVNAAGAWADTVAERCGVAPIGIQPKRRTAMTFKAPQGLDISRWPLVWHANDEFYIKPEAGLLLGSPCDETDMIAHDVQPDEIDIAVCADTIERATTLTIKRIDHRWAGLRSFAVDRNPVAGFEPGHEGFIWFAGQGGYGIQMAPALARTGAALACDETIDTELYRLIAPERLR